VSTTQIKELRDRTGAGIMDCKRALEEADGDLNRAAEILRQQGMAKAGKKAGRDARQGIIDTYIHGGRIGAMVEVNCETDFVARTDDFKNLCHEIALQVAGANPDVVGVDDLTEEAKAAGAKEFGSEAEYIKAKVLLAQPFIRDPKHTTGDLVHEAIGKLGENIIVRRFARFELGETAATETATE
jgi:elongation factor Ts